MANTSAQIEAVNWVVQAGLKARYPDLTFRIENVELIWGGTVEKFAVATPQMACGLVTTASLRTATDKVGTAKVQRLRADALFLTNLQSSFDLFIAFTEQSMRDHMHREQQNGRFPPNIELLYVRLPEALQLAVEESRRRASVETSPK